jgi:pimeloyl-CoA synthetase
LKAAGDKRGGRVFFVDRTKVTVSVLVDYLERQTVLFDTAGTIAPLKKWELADA